jgi:4'-phosphopantetheinyl transferase
MQSLTNSNINLPSIYLVKTTKSFIDEIFREFSQIGLEDKKIHIWYVKIEEKYAHQLFSFLSNDEKIKAQSFKFIDIKNKFIFCRGILRKLLSLYLDCNPKNLEFNYSVYGKPSLDNKRTGLYFNISHSKTFSVYVFTKIGEIGADIEYIRPLKYINEMGKRLFTEKGLTTFRNLNSIDKVQVYFCHWTKKEAYFKLKGTRTSKMNINTNILKDRLLEPKFNNIIKLKIYGKSFLDLKTTTFKIDKNYVFSLCYNI